MDAASTAWVMAATMGVSLMIPGLALYYGGMAGARSILNVIMMTFGAVAVTGVIWTLYGFSFAFGDSYGGVGLLGDVTEYVGLGEALPDVPNTALPLAGFATFQALFAAITVAIISGGLVDRVRFGPWLVFSGLWVTIVYLPVAHWVFSLSAPDGSRTGGWILNRLQAVDYAGGTAVHINSGVAALAAVLALGPRVGWPRRPRPNSLPLTALGGGMLWFGWFGFNAGSALASGNAACVVLLTTFDAACAAMLTWLAVEKIVDGHATTLGGITGVLAGLVAITPACGAVSPLGALAVGGLAGIVCALAVRLKYRWGFDDALDVVGVHLVGGILGTVLVGVFAISSAPNGRDGLLYGGGFELLRAQALATAAVLVFSFTLTWLLVKAVDRTLGLKLSDDAQLDGVDLAVHRERGWDLDGRLQVPSAQVSVPVPSAELPVRAEVSVAEAPVLVEGRNGSSEGVTRR
jgi:ammonium transporter, Amt family